MHGDGQQMKMLVDLLSQFTGRHVRDKTGLTGRYDFDLKFESSRGPVDVLIIDSVEAPTAD